MKKIFFTRVRVHFVILMTLCVILISSCEKEKVESENNSDNESTQNAFIVKNGVLMFKSTESFLETIDAIANLSDQGREAWEEEIGFLSQRRIINRIINAELNQDSINEVRYAINKIMPTNEAELHSDVYSEYLNKGVIKIIDEGTDDEYWDYAVFNRGFVDFINENGLYAIGDTIFQVTSTSIKALTDGDFSKVDLLIDATAPDEQNKIIFLETVNGLKGTSPGLIESAWVSSGSKRIKIGIFLDVLYYIPSSHHYDFYHEVYVQCQEKNWLGNWKYKLTEVWVNGTWSIKVFYNAQYYGNNWSFHNSASYLKACINPQTGATVPYRSVFGVNAAHPDSYDNYYEPVYFSFNWSALRNGGYSGLKATLKSIY